MPPTILLSKVIGLFLVIAGAIIAVQKEEFAAVANQFARDRPMRVMLSAIELIAALFLVVLHNDWSSLPAGIISFFGWMMLAEAVVYLAAPNRVVESLFAAFNTPVFYVIGGMLAVAIGLYLSAHGFGLL